MRDLATAGFCVAALEISRLAVRIADSNDLAHDEGEESRLQLRTAIILGRAPLGVARCGQARVKFPNEVSFVKWQ